MQGRLTLHVRRLVHISQVSGVFLKGQCQCSCNDVLTKILTPCRHGKCFRRCLRKFIYTAHIIICDIEKTSLLCGRLADCGKSLLFGYASVISFSYGYDSKLPIVLFVGQHFSGSLFHLITLLLFTRETTKGTRVRDCRP